MKELVQLINGPGLKASGSFPDFKAGDTVAVHYKINEGNKQRVQLFQGVVVRRRGADAGQTFTVRKISNNVGVERIFPLYSPHIEKLEIISQGKVRRAKLYYIRDQKGKIRVKRKIVSSKNKQGV